MSDVALFTLAEFENWTKQIFSLERKLLHSELHAAKLEFELEMYKIMYNDLKTLLYK